MKCSDLRKEKVLDFYLELKAKGLSHSTIKRYHFNLCQLFDLYLEKNPNQINPVRAIKDFRKIFPRQAPTRDINFLVPEEIDALLAEVRSSKSELLFPFIQFLVYSGLRRSEGLELKWTDIDEKAGFIHVRNSKNGEARTVPLESGAREALTLLNRKTVYVFTKSDGKRFDRDSFLRPLQRAAIRAGINKRIDIHTLRHSWGSNKIRQGWGLKKVSMMLGHKNIAITAQVYTHLLDGDLKVRDEFHFDNSIRKENSEESKVGQKAQLSPDAIMAMIEILQSQLNLTQTASVKGGSLPTEPKRNPNKNTESSRKFETGTTKCLKTDRLCYSNATQGMGTAKNISAD
jgi:integrase